MKKKKEIKEEDLKNVSGGTNTPLANAPAGDIGLLPVCLVGSVPMGVTGCAPQVNVSDDIDTEAKPTSGI